MSNINNNDARPSAADNLGAAEPGGSGTMDALRAKAAAGAETVQSTIDDVQERAGQIYTRGNVAVTRAVDPIPSLVLVAAASFLAGYVCASMRH